jgi:four helix bundle protein
MAGILSFEELKVWQKARELSKSIYVLTLKNDFSKNYSLKDQIRRSSGSCMDNIAEGFDRGGSKEFKQFLSIAKGSVAETKSQLYRALDCRYITEEEFKATSQKAEEIIKMIGGLIAYLKKTELKGIKFSEPTEHYGKLE